jgi:formamidopyrimidine-DNA glycosylase
MPERPDLEYVVPVLQRLFKGQSITAASVHNPVVMRQMVLGDLSDLVVGAEVQGIKRRAHFVHFVLSGPIDLVISPMLAGRFDHVPAKARKRKDVAFVLEFEEMLLRYRDDVQMGKVYLVPREKLMEIPGFAKIGINVLGKAFTLDKLTQLVKKERRQVKVFLMDKTKLDSMGNAYADEVLFAAGIHPKVRGTELSLDQIANLHGAIVSVLKTARTMIRRRKPPIDQKLRDHVKVRNRKGQPCPTCQTPIRAAGVHGHDAFFCPRCQPDAKGRGFVDWSRIPGRS